MRGWHGDMPTMNNSPPRPGGTQADRRDRAGTRVRRTSRAVALLATGAAAALGLVVSKEIPGVTASASNPASSSGSTSSASASSGTSSDDSSSTSSSSGSSTPT